MQFQALLTISDLLPFILSTVALFGELFRVKVAWIIIMALERGSFVSVFIYGTLKIPLYMVKYEIDSSRNTLYSVRLGCTPSVLKNPNSRIYYSTMLPTMRIHLRNATPKRLSTSMEPLNRQTRLVRQRTLPNCSTCPRRPQSSTVIAILSHAEFKKKKNWNTESDMHGQKCDPSNVQTAHANENKRRKENARCRWTVNRVSRSRYKRVWVR